MADYAPFCEKQANYLKRCPSNWLNIAEGGKRAGKNVLNIMAWCDILETHPDKLHLAAGVSVASAKLNIIDSNGFGLLGWFKGRCRAGKYQERDALYIQTLTGEKIILISGGGKEGDEKYIKGNTYGSAYITEVNECCNTFVKEVFDRTISSNNRKLFFDLNPKSPNHWFYVDILNFHAKNADEYADYGFNYEHFTLHDNFSLSDDKIREINRTYQKNTVWYERDILGRRTNAEGIIYDCWNEAVHSKDNIRFVFNNYYVTIDYGTSAPCTFGLFGTDSISPEYYDKVCLLREYYWDSKVKQRQKSDEEYCADFKEWLETECNGIVPEIVYVDPSAASFIVALEQKGYNVVAGNNDVIDGIRFTYSIIKANGFLVDSSCEHTKSEFASYVWDSKQQSVGIDAPLKINDHCMDRNRYFLYTHYGQFQTWTGYSALL